MLEPVVNAPAAVAETDQRLLIVADYHAGIEQGLRREGVELARQATGRRDRLLGLVADTDPDRLVVLGDLVHAIGEPEGPELAELESLFDALDVPTTLVKGNHDGDVEESLAAFDVTVTDPTGVAIGPVGFAHGHTYPSGEVLEADVVCIGHEHPTVRLTDEVGGGRRERVWLRGRLDRAALAEHAPDLDDELDDTTDPRFVAFPAFNDRSGGTWVNADSPEFLSPFLPEGLHEPELYLLDGTRLGRPADV